MEHLRLTTLLVASVVALAGLVVSAKSASAQDIMPTWAKWRFELKVVNDRIDATYFVIIGGEDKAGDPVDLLTRAFPVSCREIDDVKAKNDAVHFGGGYLECQFPNLMTEANKIITDKWGSQYILSPGPDCDCAPIKLGYVTVDATPEGEDANPVFLHPSIASTLHLDTQGVVSEFRFGSETSSSPAMTLNPGQTLTSRYLCDQSQGTCFFEHLYNGSTFEEKRYFTIPSFYTAAVTVHIGYDPQSGDRFDGTIRELVVDPGCRVN